MSNHARRAHRPGAARGRDQVAASLGLPPAFMRELSDGEMPEDGELMVGDAFGGRWVLFGPPADQIRASMRDACPVCSAGEDHEHA